MVEIDIWYEGDLSTKCVHRQSGEEIFTDAPKDNQGRGLLFSPTDLVAAALGSCVLTIMGILAARMKIDLVGTKITVSKEMQQAPSRRIGKLRVVLTCPHRFDPETIKRLETAAESCPVHHSLHPDIVQEFVYNWGPS
jgi:putative redox protein